MPCTDLSRLSPDEKDALILALLDRVAVLEANLRTYPNCQKGQRSSPETLFGTEYLVGDGAGPGSG
jgi:hypothetical protein